MWVEAADGSLLNLDTVAWIELTRNAQNLSIVRAVQPDGIKTELFNGNKRDCEALHAALAVKLDVWCFDPNPFLGGKKS